MSVSPSLCHSAYKLRQIVPTLCLFLLYTIYELFGKINQQIVPVYVEMERVMSNWLRFAWGERSSQWRTWRIIGCNASPDKLIYSTGSTAWSNGQSLGQTIYSTVTEHNTLFCIYRIPLCKTWRLNREHSATVISMRTYLHADFFIYRRVLPEQCF